MRLATCVVFLASISCLVLAGCDRSSSTDASATKTGTVTIEVQLGDHIDRYTVKDVAEGTTLETVMRGLDEIPVQITGSGMTAFLQGIGDQATIDGNGWIFRVDDQFASAGIGSTKLSPPTTVTWTYGDEMPPSSSTDPAE